MPKIRLDETGETGNDASSRPPFRNDDSSHPIKHKLWAMTTSLVYSDLSTKSWFESMLSPKRAKFLDFDFEIEPIVDGVLHLSEISSDEASWSEAVLCESDISTMQFTAMREKRRSSATTFYTENLPVTPEPDDYFIDVDTVHSNQCLSPTIVPDLTTTTDEERGKRVAEPQYIHEVFTAQAGTEKVGQTRRHRPMVGKELDAAKGLRPEREPGRRLVLIQLIGRITQVFVRYSTPWT